MVGRFYQKVEYERISTFCYECGMVGHVKGNCKRKNMLVTNNVDGMRKQIQDSQTDSVQEMEVNTTYGPWVHVNYKRNKMFHKGASSGRPVQKVFVKKSLNNHAIGKTYQSIGLVAKESDIAINGGLEKIIEDNMLVE